MKYLVLILTILMIPESALSLGDTSLLPDNPGVMTDTVGTLNQLAEEQVDQSLVTEKAVEPQDVQEEQFQEDKRREEEEWEESKKLEYRYDVPE